jgi:8-oxo-dGTP pyrophosphatase MutT (NUDIX family)
MTPDDIEKKLQTVAGKGARGDHSLNPGMTPGETLRDAAVLILLIPRGEGFAVLFTERTATLHAHAGQISFPGGGVEKGDADNRFTALREAAEEIGLVPENARVLGELEDYVTRTGFRVKPVVAVLENPQEWTPSPDEVARIFEVPLEYILAPGNLCEESLTFEGGERRFFACTYKQDHIWGATAGMLKSFAEALNDPSAPANDAAPRKPDAPQGPKQGPKKNSA